MRGPTFEEVRESIRRLGPSMPRQPLPFNIFPGNIARVASGRFRQELVTDWQEEASAAATAGNPARTHYLEHMIGRLGDPKFYKESPREKEDPS